MATDQPKLIDQPLKHEMLTQECNHPDRGLQIGSDRDGHLLIAPLPFDAASEYDLMQRIMTTSSQAPPLVARRRLMSAILLAREKNPANALP
jgi:hypothetical protein